MATRPTGDKPTARRPSSAKAKAKPKPMANAKATPEPRPKVTPAARPRPRARPASGEAPKGQRGAADTAARDAIAGVNAQVQTAAAGLLSLSRGVVGAARGLQLASSAARALGSGSPGKAAQLLLEALSGAEASRVSAGAAKAGAALKQLRESAGLTIDEVSKALDLKDPALIEALEGGKLALPFELILRLAAVLGRNDPIGFVMKLTRGANPEMWRSLEALGVGRLVLQSAREREFANIYRADDAARSLSDEDFAAVLAFVKAAFELAMAFRGKTP